jgi:hypothetical protein
MRRLVQDVIAPGGLDHSHFIAEGPQRMEQELGDLVDAVADKKLAGHCRTTLAACRRIFASAPPKPPPGTYGDYAVVGEEETRLRAQQVSRQVEAAHECMAAIEETLQGQSSRANGEGTLREAPVGHPRAGRQGVPAAR